MNVFITADRLFSVHTVFFIILLFFSVIVEMIEHGYF